MMQTKLVVNECLVWAGVTWMNGNIGAIHLAGLYKDACHLCI